MQGPSQESGVPQGKRDLIYSLHLDYVFIAAAGLLIRVIHLYNFTELQSIQFHSCIISSMPYSYP